MTALLGFGGGLPLALQIPHVVEQAGSLAGFAAVIGLAVLSALYFSQARDLRRLREWAGRAPERAAEMGAGAPGSPVPGRVVATPQRPPQAVQPATQAAQGAAAGNGDATKTAGDAKADGDARPEGVQADEGARSEGAQADGDAKADDAAKADGDAGAGSAPARPGMPAPASAAAAGAATAAAGAGAASLAGPKAPPAPGAMPGQGAASPAGPNAPGQAGAGPNAPSPAGPPRTTPAPQRTPGSVLPPRTGTLPPVRRLPSSNVGAAGQTSVLGPQPQQQKKKRNPVYAVLAVAGVLILGAAAAIGVPAIVNGSKDSSKTSKTASKTTTAKKNAAPLTPGKITVAVLNGTSIPGLAAQIGDRVEADGFRKGTVANATLTNGQRANSVVMYARGHQRDARLVSQKLRISTVQAVDAASQSIAGDASVVVVVGTDKTQ